MNYKWKYFIVLNWEDTLNNLVEDKIDEELIICCDVTVAKSFDSTEELLKWVKNNTDLKAGKQNKVMYKWRWIFSK